MRAVHVPEWLAAILEHETADGGPLLSTIDGEPTAPPLPMLLHTLSDLPSSEDDSNQPAPPIWEQLLNLNPSSACHVQGRVNTERWFCGEGWGDLGPLLPFKGGGVGPPGKVCKK